MADLVLASGSPRRVALLAAAGVRVAEVRPADLDETPLPGERPIDHVIRLAAAKARAVARPGEIVLAADTTVDLDGEILGKPLDAVEAAAMLRRLAGRTHAVHTAMAVVEQGAERQVVDTTLVHLGPIAEPDLAWYVGTGEPLDKAGAYALQGGASVFVTRVEGSPSTVVGLPVHRLAEVLGDLEAFR